MPQMMPINWLILFFIFIFIFIIFNILNYYIFLIKMSNFKKIKKLNNNLIWKW